MSVESLTQAVWDVLSRVNDPEIHKPITELGMVEKVEVDESGHASVKVLLTISGCPMKGTIEHDVHAALQGVEGLTGLDLEFGVMTDEQRDELKTKLRGGVQERVIPFAQADNLTQVLLIASGKGGVGKSSTTVNLAVSLQRRGLKVGVIDADIYGHSIPNMMGSTDRPHQVDEMIMPLQAHGVKLISIGHFVDDNSPVVWRGPMLHRAIQQFLGDVFWGDLDILLLDLPPGTGDVAISVAQLVPNAELLIVTTPQVAAAEVAERAGSISQQTRQRIGGVIENMSWMDLPDGSRMEPFGSGGGQFVADRLSQLTGSEIPLLGQIPLDPNLRVGGDVGNPIVKAEPQAEVTSAFGKIADQLAKRRDSLAGKSLNLGVTNN